MNDEIELEIPEAVMFFERMRSDQVPFATSLALNRIGALGKERQTAGIFERFTVRRPGRLKTAVRMKAAKKRDSSPAVTLTIRDAFLVQHEEGGIRRPGDVFRSMVQPVSPEAKRVGVVHGKWTPSAVLASDRKAFIARMPRSGKVGVFVRRGPERLPIDLVFSLEKAVKIPRLLKFGATLDSVATKGEWEKQFGQALSEAMATAR